MASSATRAEDSFLHFPESERCHEMALDRQCHCSRQYSLAAEGEGSTREPRSDKEGGFARTALPTAYCMLYTTNKYSENFRGSNVVRQLSCSLSRVLPTDTLYQGPWQSIAQPRVFSQPLREYAVAGVCACTAARKHTIHQGAREAPYLYALQLIPGQSFEAITMIILGPFPLDA